MVWTNGFISKNELVIFKTGYNNTDGDWYHGLTPATYARHLELVRVAKERTGRTLEISEGWGAYRPYDAQVKAQKIYGIGAAEPGSSSHGGYWERRETMAMDYSNWGWVYNWDRAAFYADVRKVGLTPGMIEPSRGYPDEPWHVIDLAPRSMPAYANTGSKPFNPGNTDRSEEDDMPINFRNAATGITYTMVPGVSISAHLNGFGSRLSNYVNTGVWPASESNQDRYNAGLRDLSEDHVTWMLPLYGFGRLKASDLPTSGGIVYSDAQQAILDRK